LEETEIMKGKKNFSINLWGIRKDMASMKQEQNAIKQEHL
jgi:hypothetical protein